MKTLSKNNRILYWAQIIIVGLAVGLGIQLVQAWTGPSQPAPNGNVAGPLTVGATQQTKTGNLILGNDLAVSRNAVLGSYVSTSNTTGLCLSGICHRTWASVLAGVGGGVTSITGNNGINVNQSTGPVTVSANTSILQARITGTCPAGQSIRAVAANGTVTCEVDDTGAGGGVTSISGGTGITVNQSTGNVTVSSDVNSIISAIFSGATTHTCNNISGSTANPLLCTITGNKNMCFLTNVFGRDGDDVDGFGCSVYRSGSNWVLRAVGEDYAQTYCQATCI